ncbi:MAG: hypothetical protein PSX80_17490 [bacterium]|nr:hypothetical protein [bacterium]
MAALQIFTIAARPQGVEVEITVDRTARTASVSGQTIGGSSSSDLLSVAFKREVSGFPDLGSRIRSIELADLQGNPVSVRKLMEGEYVAASDFRFWKYAVDLTPPKDRTGYAHASWIADNRGVLMLGDLLPQYFTRPGKLRGRVKLKLPDGWTLNSSDAPALGSEDLHSSVIFIGKSPRAVEVTGDLKLVLSGEWHFTDDEAAQMAREIFDEYSKMLGDLPKKPFLIALQRFPTQESPGQWEAETRGRTVTIFSSDMPFRTQSLQRLHEQLRHEIFHLWFPNGIDLIGDYAWFYEGFAMYSSLKLAVKLNRIRFEDFLDTLGRAHTIDTNSKPRRPLTDGSIDPTIRYARGMLIAFLTDLELLRNSGGKTDVGKSLRDLFTRHPRVPHGVPATDAVKTVVTHAATLERYVDGADAIDWTAKLAAVGIRSTQTGRTTTLAVEPKPSGRQKEILDRLGYNNWRKIGTKK